MKYALIADIHGNYPALEAVLRDAAARNVDRYLFLGDYYGEFPFPNQVAEAIRSLPCAAIRGNKEDYLINLSAQDQSGWIDEQMAPIYWAYQTMSGNNRFYLMALPAEQKIEIGSATIHIFHAAKRHFGDTNLMQLGSRSYAQRMRAKPFSPPEYVAYIQSLVSGDEALRRALNGCAGDVFAFGHSHTQWHLFTDGALLINPASCGMPLDFDLRAPYSILDVSGDGSIHVEECRVPYDIDRTVSALRESELYRRAPIWSEIAIRQLRTAEEELSFFLQSVEALAQKLNRPRRPYDNDVWRAAGDDWFQTREKL